MKLKEKEKEKGNNYSQEIRVMTIAKSIDQSVGYYLLNKMEE